MRSAAVTLLVVSALGLAGLVVTAAGDGRELAFTIGVVPTTAAATLAPGETVCQSPISVSEPFSRVGLRTGAPRDEGQPLTVIVRTARGTRVLGRGRLGGGFPDQADLTTAVGQVAAGQRIAVCARNAGNRAAIVYGNAAGAAPPSEATQKGRTLDTDLAIVFLKDQQRSVLSELPDVFHRASLFRPGWVGEWTFWALTVLVLLSVPLLLARALRETAP